MIRLSANFTLSEMVFSQTAIRKGIDNTPGTQELVNLVRTCVVLEEVRALFNAPIMVSSGYRCKKLNTAIRGSRTSDHIKGLAVDFVVANHSVDEVFRVIKKSTVPYSQLIHEFGRWIHLAIPEVGEIPQDEALFALKVDGLTHYRNAA